MQNSLLIKELAHTYAAALYDVANDQSTVQSVARVLATVEAVSLQSSDFVNFISNKSLSNAVKVSGIQAVLESVLDKTSIPAIFETFLQTLSANNRIGILGVVATAFSSIQQTAEGVVHADVCSAIPLTKEQEGALAASLEKTLGKNIHLTTTTNPALLGGLTIKVGARLYDSSLATQLNKLKHHLLSPAI